MLEEQWVPLEGYPNYEVSNYGRIGNVRTGRDLKPYTDKRTGALRVALYNNGKRKDVQVNRIVAKCFFLNYKDEAEVYHENGNKSDCAVLNLTLKKPDPIEQCAHVLAHLPKGKTISFDLTEADLVKVITMAREIRKRNGID